ncbi:GIY-YIG nuclease family protein [Glaciimonas sp. GG7]
MTAGKSIRIYLADGSVSGIRHGEIVNWTGQAIACTRTRFGDLKDWPEARRPGVYFLFGINDQTGQEALYIGEAEVVFERLGAHLTGKEFWNELIAFTSKDDNLTKGHVRYIESRLIQLASTAGRYLLTNTASPQLPALPRADRDSMEEFIVNLRTLLGVLGHRALEPLTGHPAKLISSIENPVAQLSASLSPNDSFEQQITFSLKVNGIDASAIRTDEGIVVLAGSQVSSTVKSSLSDGYKALREKLISSRVIVGTEGTLRLSRNHLFSSPSQAAAIIVGYAINGRDAWRTNYGKTWSDIEAATVYKLLNEITSPT